MTPDEVVARLRSLRYSPVRGTHLGLKYVASRAGCSYVTLYRAMETGKMSPGIAADVKRALDGIANVRQDNTPRAALLRSMFTPAELAKLPRS